MGNFSEELSKLTNEEIDTFKKVNILDYIVKKIQKNEIEVNEVAKFARIIARQGKVGEEIVTIMKNGNLETKNVVKIDEKTGEPGWIVTNPDGEQYIVEDSNFKKKYEIDPENPEQYKPKGGPVLSAKIDEDIEFLAPWGESMRIYAGGSAIISGKNDIYGIQKDEFNNTYKSTQKDSQKCLEELKEKLEFDKIISNEKEEI